MNSLIKRWLCLLIAGMSAALALHADSEIYWTESTGGSGKILRGNPNAGISDVVSFNGGSTLEYVNGQLYWLELQTTAVIRRSAPDGTGAVNLVTRPATSLITDVDAANGFLYWPERSFGATVSYWIMRANADGSSPASYISLPTTTFTAPAAVKATSTYIYWSTATEGERPGKLYRAPLTDLGNIQELLSGFNISDIEIKDNYLYFSDSIDRSNIFRANLDGTGLVEHVKLRCNAFPGGIAVDTHIYWAEVNPKKIRRCELDGTGETDLLTLSNSPSSVVVAPLTGSMTDTALLWTELTSPVKIRRFSLADPPPALVLNNVKIPNGIEAFGDDLYWPDSQATSSTYLIHKRNRGGGLVSDITTGSGSPITDVEVSGSHVFWTEMSANQIMRADLNGGGRVRLLNVLTPLAIDVANSVLYWSSFNENKIRRTSLDANGDVAATPVITDIITSIRATDIEVVGAQLYYTSVLFNPVTISRSDLSGGNKANLVSTGLSFSLDGLDVTTQFLYWSDPNNGTIGRANLDGANIKQLYTGRPSPKGVAVFE